MINSQIPYNQLKLIRELNFPDEDRLRGSLDACRNILFHLNGYLDAMGDRMRYPLEMLQVADAKFSFELEGLPIALGRLFEAMGSENRLGDEVAEMIFRYVDTFPESDARQPESLYPLYLKGVRKPGDLLREKQEVCIQSYHTNLTLYTAPSQSGLIRALRSELAYVIQHPSACDPLVFMCIVHYQMRVLAPYVRMNGHVARSWTKLYLRQMGLAYDVLPLAQVLYGERERYNTLIRESIQSDSCEKWCGFMLDALHSAARLMLGKLKRITQLKAQYYERLSKYTECHFPAAELNEVLFRMPYIKPAHITEATGCHRHTAYNWLKHLCAMGALVQKTSGREKLYINRELLDVLGS